MIDTKYNLTKDIALLYLNSATGLMLPASELANKTGLPYRSLVSKLPRWYKWGYVKRLAAGGKNGERPHYVYYITDKGRQYCKKLSPGRVKYCQSVYEASISVKVG